VSAKHLADAVWKPGIDKFTVSCTICGLLAVHGEGQGDAATLAALGHEDDCQGYDEEAR
jgi:hypothetical protein